MGWPKAPASPSLDDFERYVEQVPSRLGIWRIERVGLLGLIAWINAQSSLDSLKLAQEIGPVAAGMTATAATHNTIALSCRWALQYAGSGTGTQEPSCDDRQALLKRAETVWSLRDLIRSTRAGAYSFESQGRTVHFAFAGDRRFDTLDRLLDVVRSLDKADFSRPDPRELRKRLEASPVQSWRNTNEAIRILWRAAARAALDSHDSVFSDSTELAGYTIGDLKAVWVELSAYAMHHQRGLLAGPKETFWACPHLAQKEIVDLLRPSGIPAAQIAAVIDDATFDPERNDDPCLAPLLPVDAGLAVPSSLIIYSGPERNALMLARQNAPIQGRLANDLGRYGSAQVAGLFEGYPFKVAKGIKLFRSNKSVAGDLDVVVLDPSDRVVLVFEVKWHLPVDGAREINAALARAMDGQRQARAIRAGLEAGHLRPRWPQGWPDPTGWHWHWFILTNDVLPVIDTMAEPEIRSHQLLFHIVGRAAKDGGLRNVADRLREPPSPPAELCQLTTTESRFGSYLVSAASVAIS